MQNKYVGNPPSRRYGHSATAIGTLEDTFVEVCVGLRLSQNERLLPKNVQEMVVVFFSVELKADCWAQRPLDTQIFLRIWSGNPWAAGFKTFVFNII